MTGRRLRKKSATRDALLKAAMSLIAKNGIYSTRVEDITELADIAKGAFYNYFDSKDALVADLVIQGVDTLRQNYLNTSNLSNSLTERISSIVQAHSAFFRDHSDYALLFHQSRGLLEVGSSSAERLQMAFTEYLQCVGEVAFPSGACDKLGIDVRMDLAAVITGAIAGYRSFRVASGTEPNYKALAEIMISGFPNKLLQQMNEPTVK